MLTAYRGRRLESRGQFIMINTVRKCVQDTEIHFNWGEEKVFWGRHPTDGYEQEQLGQRLECLSEVVKS